MEQFSRRRVPRTITRTYARVSDVKCDFTGNKVRNPIYRKVVVVGPAMHAKYSNSCDSCRPRGNKHRIRLRGVNGETLMRKLHGTWNSRWFIIDSTLLRAEREPEYFVYATQRAAGSLSLVSSLRISFRALHSRTCSYTYCGKYIGRETLLEISLTPTFGAEGLVWWHDTMFIFFFFSVWPIRRNETKFWRGREKKKIYNLNVKS